MKRDQLLSPEAQETLQDSQLCWVHAQGADGLPFLALGKTPFSESDSTVVVGVQPDPLLRQCVAAQPAVRITLLDKARQRGFELYGSAQLIQKDHHTFQDRVALAREPSPEFLLLRIERIQPLEKLIAPVPSGLSPEQMAALANRTFGPAHQE